MYSRDRWVRSTHRQNQLDDAVQDFYVLVLQPAALNGDQLRVLQALPPGGSEGPGRAAGPVVLPPGRLGGQPQGQDVTVLQSHNRTQRNRSVAAWPLTCRLLLKREQRTQGKGEGERESKKEARRVVMRAEEEEEELLLLGVVDVLFL